MSGESAVDFATVANAKDKNQQAVSFDFADKPVFANAVLPKLSQLGTAQSLSNAADSP
jgi:hypothetical protein